LILLGRGTDRHEADSLLYLGPRSLLRLLFFNQLLGCFLERYLPPCLFALAQYLCSFSPLPIQRVSMKLFQRCFCCETRFVLLLLLSSRLFEINRPVCIVV
jgi:hypothetical protein